MLAQVVRLNAAQTSAPGTRAVRGHFAVSRRARYFFGGLTAELAGRCTCDQFTGDTFGVRPRSSSGRITRVVTGAGRDVLLAVCFFIWTSWHLSDGVEL